MIYPSIDKLLTIVEYNNITPIICLTKLDLLNDEEEKVIEQIIAYYNQPPDLGGWFYGIKRVGPRNRNVASRKLGRSSNCFMNLAPPIPQPPCGGIPYRKHSRYHCSPG